MKKMTSKTSVLTSIFFMIGWGSALCHCHADVDDGTVLHQGIATFYGEGGLGHCGFTNEQPAYHGAMNHIDYDSSAACGTWVHIFGPKGDVVAFIDDECPECKEGDIDLGPNTFDVVADRALGRVPITWRYVPAPVSGPVQYYWKDGTSRYHIELQVRNHRYGIVQLEIQTQTSDWVTVDRYPYNFFKLYGGVNAENGPYNIRITDVFGNKLVDSLMTIIPGGTFEGKANFTDKGDAIIRVSKGAISDVSRFTKRLTTVKLDRSISCQASSVTLYSFDGKKRAVITADNNGMCYLPNALIKNGIVIIQVNP